MDYPLYDEKTSNTQSHVISFTVMETAICMYAQSYHLLKFGKVHWNKFLLEPIFCKALEAVTLLKQDSTMFFLEIPEIFKKTVFQNISENF